MSLALPKNRIRITCDAASHGGLTCRLQGGVPKIWRGNDTYIEVGLFFDEAIVDSVTDIAQVVLDIIPYADRDGAPLVEKTASAVSCTNADWIADTDSKYSARFALAAADTQFDMAEASENILALWLVVHVVTTAGARITYGAGQIQVEEDGAQNGLAVVPPQGNNYRPSPTTGLPQFYNPDTGKWHSFQPRGPAGAVVGAWEQNGED